MTTAYRDPTDDHTWRVLKALGNPVRLQIVRYIQQHPRCIGNQILLQLPDDCSRAQSTLSQHLKILREAEVITTESDGSATCYTVNQEQLDWLTNQIHRLIRNDA